MCLTRSTSCTSCARSASWYFESRTARSTARTTTSCTGSRSTRSRASSCGSWSSASRSRPSGWRRCLERSAAGLGRRFAKSTDLLVRLVEEHVLPPPLLFDAELALTPLLVMPPAALDGRTRAHFVDPALHVRKRRPHAFVDEPA